MHLKLLQINEKESMKKIYSATITPLNDRGQLDINSLERVFERNIRHGISGIFILGTMGEWSQFDNHFRDNLVKTSVDIVGNRIEILAGIHAAGLDLTLKNIERLADIKCDSYVLTLPSTSRINPIEYITSVLEATDKPVYYYHCPVNNGINLSIPQFEEFLNHPKLKGLKNSSGNMMLRKELIMLKKKCDFTLLEGHEWAVDESLLMGCDGALCGAGALASRPMVLIAKAVDSGNIHEAIRIQHKLIQIFHGVYGQSLESVWVGQKYALKYLKIIDNVNTLVESSALLTPQRKQEIEACIDQYRTLLD